MDNKGLTLVELVLYIVIGACLIGFLWNLPQLTRDIHEMERNGLKHYVERIWEGTGE